MIRVMQPLMVKGAWIVLAAMVAWALVAGMAAMGDGASGIGGQVPSVTVAANS